MLVQKLIIIAAGTVLTYVGEAAYKSIRNGVREALVKERERGETEPRKSPVTKRKVRYYRSVRERNAAHRKSLVMKSKLQYEPEYSPDWERGDEGVTKFFTYILRLSNGRLYVGHTRNMMRRFQDHRSNKVWSTKGRNPKLVWFLEFPTRDGATEREALLKQTVDTNTDSIEKMISFWQDAADWSSLWEADGR